MKRKAELDEPAEVAVRSALEKLEDVRGCRVGLCVTGLEGPLAGVGFGFGEERRFRARA